MESLLAMISDWISARQELLTWLTIGSLFTFVASLLALPWLVSLIPQDYFLPKHREPTPWKDAHPLIRLVLLAIKNILGLILLCGGTLMLFLPGQGLLTIAMGLILMDYPGKFRFERRLAGLPGVLRSLNWLRAKRHQPPLHTNIEHKQ
jgi:hypothetical protein